MQEDERISKFCGREIRMTKIVLADANKILVPIMNGISKFSMGETDLFLHLRVIDLENIQKMMCQYITWLDNSKNLTLFDISNGLSEFMVLISDFLEFNFGFFSQARKVQRIKLSGQPSETNEMPKT